MPTPIPSVSITNTLKEFELAYGKNVISCYDNNSASPLFVCQIYNSGSATATFDVRQFCNLAGYAHFDVQNLLKSQLGYLDNIETITRLTTHSNEVYGYQAKVGYVSNDVVTLQASSSIRYVLPGRKAVTEIEWDSSDYLPQLNSSSALGVDTIQVYTKQKALTDRHIESTTGAAITDGKPSFVSSGDTVWKIEVKRGNDYTISFLNDWVDFVNGPPRYHNGIATFLIAAYSGSTELYNSQLPNTTGNGGGPNTLSSGQSGSVAPEYKVLSVQVGNSSQPLGTYLATATHVYVCPAAWGSGNFANYSDLSDIYRIDITDCEGRDFDTYQVSWINSFGFRDYFHFTKRDDNVNNVTRNTFKKLDADWGGATISVNSYDRGEKVLNQMLSDEYTINTRYLTDAEMGYLKNLILSPDVRVKFPGQNTWVSVIPTTNQWTSRTFRKDKLFQLTYSFRLANPIQLQNG